MNYENSRALYIFWIILKDWNFRNFPHTCVRNLFPRPFHYTFFLYCAHPSKQKTSPTQVQIAKRQSKKRGRIWPTKFRENTHRHSNFPTLLTWSLLYLDLTLKRECFTPLPGRNETESSATHCTYLTYMTIRQVLASCCPRRKGKTPFLVSGKNQSLLLPSEILQKNVPKTFNIRPSGVLASQVSQLVTHQEKMRAKIWEEEGGRKNRRKVLLTKKHI